MRRDPSDFPLMQSRSLSPKPRRELMLYVEDDDDNWEVSEFRLSDSFEVLRAATSEEACKIVCARRSETEVILMDIELRGSDLKTVELTELMRGNSLPADRCIPAYARNLPRVYAPVIYVTAHGRRQSNAQLMLSGADKVIAKPVDFDDLRNSVAEFALNRSRG